MAPIAQFLRELRKVRSRPTTYTLGDNMCSRHIDTRAFLVQRTVCSLTTHIPTRTPSTATCHNTCHHSAPSHLRWREPMWNAPCSHLHQSLVLRFIAFFATFIVSCFRKRCFFHSFCDNSVIGRLHRPLATFVSIFCFCITVRFLWFQLVPQVL